MKKLIVMGMLLSGFAGFCQENVKKDGKREQLEKMTSEQRNELHVKKLTLDLNLTDSQQKEISKLLKEESDKRDVSKQARKADKQDKVKPTADEQFARQSKMLDDKIAFKAKVRKILNEEQFSKWEKNDDQRNKRISMRKHHRKPSGQNGSK